ncbi:Uncharacterised protein [Vibrio cholerae]|nr:Uncharacterised protein [Vibrio cholerae]
MAGQLRRSIKKSMVKCAVALKCWSTIFLPALSVCYVPSSLSS